MVLKNFFDEFLFPKIMIIDRPGIIINKSIRKFGGESTRTRIIYHFEDISKNLYLETKRKLGKEEADFLWYKIGKDMATRYFLFSKKKKISNILMPFIIEHIFKTFSGVGLNFSKNVNYNQTKKSLIATGRNCVICKEIGTGHIAAGLTSGVLSSLNNINIEAEPACTNCPNNCRIIASPKIKKKYIPNFEKLKPIKNYDKLNFPEKESSEAARFQSFSDFLKFKKITVDKQNNFFYFCDKIIVPSEMGSPGIVLKNYLECNQEKLFQESVIKTTEGIMEDILKHQKTTKNKIKILCNIISAFGWGIPFHKKIKNQVIFEFLYPPINNENDSLFRALILNGYLNGIYNKKFKIHYLKDNQMGFIY